MAGMRDDRDDYSYVLPDGSERSFRLKYVGFECWASFREGGVTIKLKHFLPGDSDVVVCYPIPVENLLFRTERRLTFDADGFLEDAWDPGAYVRMEQLPP